MRYQHFSLCGLGANPWAKVYQFAKIADNLLLVQLYHTAKFHCLASTHAGDIRYKVFADKQRNSKQYPRHAYRHVEIISNSLQLINYQSSNHFSGAGDR